METMWSPWRSKYIGTFKDEVEKSKEECFLCAAGIKMDNNMEADRDILVVMRYKHCFVILNKFPYNNGHVLVAPYSHVGDFAQLADDVLCEMTLVSKKVVAALQKIYNPHGFNFGANIGEFSGAGLPGHIHFHIVPRWGGDASFMTVLSDIKVVSIAIEDTWNDLYKELNG